MFIHQPVARMLLVLLILTVAALGCSDASAPTAPGATEHASTTLEMALTSGAEIVRFTDGNFIFRHHGAPDRTSGLQSFHSSLDLGHLCATGQPLFHGVEVQKVLLPTNDGAVAVLAKADELYTVVTSEVLTDFSSCAAIFENFVAQGLTSFRATDNDVSGTSRRADAFGHTAHGILELAEGGQARYGEVKRLTFIPGAAEAISDVYQINLTPIGSPGG